MSRIGETVSSLLPLTLQTNIVTLQTMQTDQQPGPLYASIDVGAKKFIPVICKLNNPCSQVNSRTAGIAASRTGPTLLNFLSGSEFVLELQVKCASRERQIRNHTRRLKSRLHGITIEQVGHHGTNIPIAGNTVMPQYQVHQGVVRNLSPGIARFPHPVGHIIGLCAQLP